MTENGLASIKRHVSAKFPIANGLIIIVVKIMLMTMMKIIMTITIENEKLII